MASDRKFQNVRGTKDFYGEDMLKFRKIAETAEKISKKYNYEEIQTPIFEFSEVFAKNLGDASDIVLKEVYQFEDRGGNSLTLRPEFTAGIVRALASNGELMLQMPKGFFCYGPVFRYDRPQKGRYRQFNQLNFEMFGKKSPLADVELIAMGYEIIKELGLKKDVTLTINTLGDKETKAKYETALTEYFTKFKDKLSDDSKIRLEKNPLRILDSKDEGDRALLNNAPQFADFYTEEAKEFFEKVLEGLDTLDIKYVVDPLLVRGLDYYTSTVFEFVTDKLGSQSTVLAGGRYDDMVGKVTGKELSAIGFGSGVERLMLLLDGIEQPKPAVAVLAVTDNENIEALKLSQKLRSEGVKSALFAEGSFKKRIKGANKIGAKYVIILGEEEIKTQQYTLKDFEKGMESKVSFEEILRVTK